MSAFDHRAASRRHFLQASAAMGTGYLLGDFTPHAWGADRSYTVKPGDTLGSIAKSMETSVEAIRAKNGMTGDLIRVGQKLILPPAGVTTPTVTHTVRAGDTIGHLAKTYGTTVDRIKQLNGLDSHLIRVGQKLRIPGNADPYSMIKNVVSATSRMTIGSKRWKYIVLHHSATPNGNASIFGNYHKSRGMTNGLAYHFVIGNGSKSRDGEVEIGPRWPRQIQGGHVSTSSVNAVGIGICLVGNFESTRPTPRQVSAMYQLVGYLKTHCARYAKVAVHKEINPGRTLCPGRFFPTRDLHGKFG